MKSVFRYNTEPEPIEEEAPEKITRPRDFKPLRLKGDSNVKSVLQQRFDDIVSPMPRDKAAAIKRGKNVGINVKKVGGQDVVMQPQFTTADKGDEGLEGTSTVDLDTNLDNIKSRQQQRLDAIAQQRQEMIANATPAVRRSSGYQWSELATAAFVADRRVSSVDDILASNIPETQIANYDEFVRNTLDANPEDVRKFLEVLKDQFESAGLSHADPSDVFIRANNNQLGPPEILGALNSIPKGEDPKADVLFTDRNGKHQGISVKQSKDATLTNYSVEKLLTEMSQRLGLESDGEELDLGQELGDARREMLALGDDQGSIPPTKALAKAFYPNALDANGKWSLGQIPGMRDRINALFQDRNNAYHRQFRQIFRQYPEEIRDAILSRLFREDLPFNLSQFDGTDLIRFNKQSLFGDGRVDLQLAENPGRERGAAKQFLGWLANGKPKYRGELRHKGEPWSSQQFFMQRDSRFNPWTGD